MMNDPSTFLSREESSLICTRCERLLPPLAGETTFDESGTLVIDGNDALIRQDDDGAILEVVCAHCMTSEDVEDMHNVIATEEYVRNGGG